MGKMLIKIFDADAFAYDLIWIDFGKCFHVDYDQEILFFFYGFLKIETCFIKKNSMYTRLPNSRDMCIPRKSKVRNKNSINPHKKM